MAGKGLPGPLRLPIIILALSFVILSRPDMASIIAAEAATSEADILQEFKATLSAGGGDEALRSWSSGSSPCSENHSTWTGVICINGKVWGLQLENMNLSGQLTVAALGRLPSLRAISFMSNNLVGPFPDISKLGALKALYLSNNQLSGEIPDDAFAETRSLKKVYLENNEFTGKIPSSLTLLSKLMMLRLDNNQFQGEIPDLKQPNLMMLNVANNKLEGRIPESLSSIDRNAFKGNGKLCGRPIDTCEAADDMSRASLIGIIVGCIVAVLIILLLVFCLCCRGDRDRDRDRVDDTTYDHPSAAPGSKARSSDATDADRLEQGSASGGSTGGGRRGSRDAEHGKLLFIREERERERERERFELQDLLRASAEVLGSGNFGSSYKAVLINGPSVVVKRFKDMNRVGREEFHEHMRRLGRLSHPNVLPLVAYYYRKEEKLIITNYILNGSLAHMLHGNRGSNLPPLEWPTRLKIIKGVARGLAYLYEELPMLTLPHGHLKSSNVLIDDNYQALLTDYALVPVVNQSHASQVMVAYKSPEVAGTGKPSKKSDVWSLGILILEVMTGKFPSTYLQKGKGGTDDLLEWVKSVAKDGDVFDSEMNKTKSGQGQMSKLLRIGLGCCEANADKRWEMKEALDRIEELKEMEIDDDSSLLSEVELGSSY